MASEHVLGIDIGGSGIKAAIVDPVTGAAQTERNRVATDPTRAPAAMLTQIAGLIESFDWRGPIGCTFPGVVRDSRRIETAANLDDGWIGTDLAAAMNSLTNSSVHVLNDGDAAGIAEMRFGTGRGVSGVVAMITVGTGLGTVLFVDGRLVPNLELGHLEIDGIDAEMTATSGARKRLGLSVEEWAPSLDRYLLHFADLIRPDLIILGGGVSSSFDKFGSLLTVDVPIRAAAFGNTAGIVGAAVRCHENHLLS